MSPEPHVQLQGDLGLAQGSAPAPVGAPWSGVDSHPGHGDVTN